MDKKLSHFPVMVNEIISFIKPQNNGIYLDCTFGQGGYTKAIFKKSEKANIVAIDQDSEAKIFVEELSKEFKDNFFFFCNKFSEIETVLKKIDQDQFDGILLDLGMSNTQLNNPLRGFSFEKDGPLDMRMDFNNNKLTAKEIINNYSERDLANIFYYYGEEKNSRKIAKQIINSRSKAQINTTSELSKIIKRVNFDKFKNPSTRVFQALRIYVNDELNELEFFLNKSINILKKKGRIAIIAFHSLEDRIVKNFIKKQSGLSGQLKIVTKKPVLPSPSEIKINSRSRSAKLRVAEKI
jgi:16S rRNA (cytosine1402-N4)-methyltransferase